MYCIGLTGNIASGKSSVANFFKKLGVEVISADLIARNLTDLKSESFAKIKEHFGDGVINTLGDLDRTKLRQIIFAQPTEKIWLENLLHPLIRKQILLDLAKVKSPYCIIEIPLLYNRDDFPYLDRVLLISAPNKLKIKRLMQRDNCSEQHAKILLDSQQVKDLNSKLKVDDIIDNSYSLANLEEQIKNLNERYLELAVARR